MVTECCFRQYDQVIFSNMNHGYCPNLLSHGSKSALGSINQRPVVFAPFSHLSDLTKCVLFLGSYTIQKLLKFHCDECKMLRVPNEDLGFCNSLLHLSCISKSKTKTAHNSYLFFHFRHFFVRKLWCFFLLFPSHQLFEKNLSTIYPCQEIDSCKDSILTDGDASWFQWDLAT